MTKEESVKPVEQFNYGCDACSLSIVINGVDLMVVNCVGDGEGTVYINDNRSITHRPRHQYTDLVLSFGDYDDDAEDITVGLRRFDICKSLEPVMILKGKHFKISRVQGTRDFVFDVKGLKVIRRPKSNVVSSILYPDPWIDIPETKEDQEVKGDQT